MTEQLRVIESAKVLKANNLDKFGHLMAESHHSLRYDYEVSCAELDHISDMLNSNKACLGARMTGAGFGGCCIALIRTNDIATIEKELIASYKERFGIEPDFYACVPSDGVHSIA
jgi:galactokinase